MRSTRFFSCFQLSYPIVYILSTVPGCCTYYTIYASYYFLTCARQQPQIFPRLGDFCVLWVKTLPVNDCGYANKWAGCIGLLIKRPSGAYFPVYEVKWRSLGAYRVACVLRHIHTSTRRRCDSPRWHTHSIQINIRFLFGIVLNFSHQSCVSDGKNSSVSSHYI